jgi:hypothetical protein
MIGTSHIVAAARLVRIAVATFAVAVLVGFIAVESFVGRYGEPQQVQAMDVRSNDTELVSAISAQESTGLTCREEPALTDVVLFQRLGESAVRVLTFEQAVAASTAHEGWIRRYCV